MPATYLYPPGAAGGSNSSVGTAGSAAPASATEIAGVTAGGILTPVLVDSSGNVGTRPASGPLDLMPATQSISVVDSGTTTTVGANNQQLYTGTPTAGSAAVFPLTSNDDAVLEFSGTWTGTLQVEVSVDGGTTYTPHSIHQFGSPLFTATFTANVIGSLNVAGKTHLRVRAIAAMTGSATVRAVLTNNIGSIYVANAIKLVDASSSTSTVQATIKAASTAAAATDTSLVVAVSPNSPVTVGNFPTTQQVTGSGAAGSPAAGVVSIQGVASGTVVPISGAVTANQGTANATPWNENLAQVGGSAIALGQAAMSSSLPVTFANNQTALPIQNSPLQLTTASISALNGDVLSAVDVSAYSSVLFQLTGTWTATVSFQGSNDNVNFVSVLATQVNTGLSSPTPTINFPTAFIIPVQTRYLRVRVTAYTSGTVAGAGTALTNAPQDLGERFVSSIQGSSASLAGAWAVKLTDTVSGSPVAVKAASTAATAADFSLVVALSPNSPLPSQSGSSGTANAPFSLTYTTGSPVTTSAYTQLIASTTSAANYLDIFDSSGQAMIWATGAAGSEVPFYYVPPGGDQIRVAIPASTRIAIKALNANATSGQILLNLLK